MLTPFDDHYKIGTTERVSVATNSHEGNNANAFAVVSFDDQYGTFRSSASNFVAHFGVKRHET